MPGSPSGLPSAYGMYAGTSPLGWGMSIIAPSAFRATPGAAPGDGEAAALSAGGLKVGQGRLPPGAEPCMLSFGDGAEPRVFVPPGAGKVPSAPFRQPAAERWFGCEPLGLEPCGSIPSG